MNFNHLRKEMAENAQRIRALVEGLADDQARWKSDPDTWSILEVVNHLADEEEADFRPRLEITLFRPDKPWPPIDPAGWVTERDYNSRDLAESLDRLMRARRASLAWLQEVESPDWETSYQAPFGQIRAGDLFASWVAHDLLHIRQLVELHWVSTAKNVAPYSTNYAGEW